MPKTESIVLLMHDVDNGQYKKGKLWNQQKKIVIIKKIVMMLSYILTILML